MDTCHPRRSELSLTDERQHAFGTSVPGALIGSFAGIGHTTTSRHTQ